MIFKNKFKINYISLVYILNTAIIHKIDFHMYTFMNLEYNGYI